MIQYTHEQNRHIAVEVTWQRAWWGSVRGRPLVVLPSFSSSSRRLRKWDWMASRSGGKCKETWACPCHGRSPWHRRRIGGAGTPRCRNWPAGPRRTAVPRSAAAHQGRKWGIRTLDDRKVDSQYSLRCTCSCTCSEHTLWNVTYVGDP